MISLLSVMGSQPAGEEISRRLLNRDEYHRAAEAGVFRPDERLELIQGEVIQKMPQLPPHSMTLGTASDALQAAFGPVRGSLPRNGKLSWSELFEQKSAAIFQRVYDAYFGAGRSVYAVAAWKRGVRRSGRGRAGRVHEQAEPLR